MRPTSAYARAFARAVRRCERRTRAARRPYAAVYAAATALAASSPDGETTVVTVLNARAGRDPSLACALRDGLREANRMRDAAASRTWPAGRLAG